MGPPTCAAGLYRAADWADALGKAKALMIMCVAAAEVKTATDLLCRCAAGLHRAADALGKAKA
jgi:hypothetical protein